MAARQGCRVCCQIRLGGQGLTGEEMVAAALHDRPAPCHILLPLSRALGRRHIARANRAFCPHLDW
jgi:hypothetical protein